MSQIVSDNQWKHNQRWEETKSDIWRQFSQSAVSPQKADGHDDAGDVDHDVADLYIIGAVCHINAESPLIIISHQAERRNFFNVKKN